MLVLGQEPGVAARLPPGSTPIEWPLGLRIHPADALDRGHPMLVVMLAMHAFFERTLLGARCAPPPRSPRRPRCAGSSRGSPMSLAVRPRGRRRPHSPVSSSRRSPSRRSIHGTVLGFKGLFRGDAWRPRQPAGGAARRRAARDARSRSPAGLVSSHFKGRGRVRRPCCSRCSRWPSGLLGRGRGGSAYPARPRRSRARAAISSRSRSSGWLFAAWPFVAAERLHHQSRRRVPSSTSCSIARTRTS